MSSPPGGWDTVWSERISWSPDKFDCVPIQLRRLPTAPEASSHKHVASDYKGIAKLDKTPSGSTAPPLVGFARGQGFR